MGRRTLRLATASLLLASAVVACSSSGGSSSGPARPAPVVASLKVLGARDGLRIGATGAVDTPARRRLAGHQFSAWSFETELLFSVVHPAADRWDFGPADQTLAWAQANHLQTTATHFFWDPPSIPSVLPDWMRSITDPDQLRAAMRNHLQVLHDRYGGKIDRWDVVNEPLAASGDLEAANHYFQVLGPGWVAEALRMAKEIWPDTTLVLNETVTEYISGKADGLVRLLTDLKAQGVPLDRVGFQAHLFLGEPDWALMADTMHRVAALGYGVDITEMDVPQVPITNDSRVGAGTQARRAGRAVRTCLDQPACGSITFWGLDDGHTWLDDYIGPGTKPLLFDADLQPKPMFAAVRDELAQGR